MSDLDWSPFTRDDADEAPEAPVDALFGGRPAPAPVAAMDRVPARRLVVVTCMDSRIDPLPALGLRTGDAHVIRNAGVVVSDDVLRSIEVSQSVLGTDRVLLLGHTGCAAYPTAEETRAALREGLERVPGRAVAAIYDLDAGRLEPVG